MQELLRQHFARVVALTDEEFDQLLGCFQLKTFRKRQSLFQVGDPVHYAYFVVSGLLKLIYTDETGKQNVLAFAMEDWWESDFGTYFSRNPATLSLVCLENTVVYCLSLEHYTTLCQQMPSLTRFFLQKANRGYISLQQRLLSLFSTRAAQRYDQLLQRYPGLGKRVSKTLLASYLGVSREALSRLTDSG